jgi:Fe-S-cluster-containing hydrogenase component 2
MIACSLRHEGKMWPAASRIRVFMLVPGVEIPHLCAQCSDYPCVASCPTKALSVSERTSAVLVDDEKCISCGKCIEACPGKVPFLHPATKKALICDLCDGDPECVKACQKANFDAIWLVREPQVGFGGLSHKLFARTPEEVTKDVAINLYGERGEELI